MTTIHMFKNHPKKKEIKFIILPIAAEILRATSDTPMNIYDLMKKYANGKPKTCGLNFDWSRIFLHGIPDLWRINVLTDPKR